MTLANTAKNCATYHTCSESIVADIGDHVWKGWEPDVIEGTEQRNLTEIVLPNLKRNYFHNALDPMSRQNFDHLVTEIQVEAPVQQTPNFVREKIFILSRIIFKQGLRWRKRWKIDEIVEFEVSDVMRDAAMTMTHRQVVWRNAKVKTDVDNVNEKSEN